MEAKFFITNPDIAECTLTITMSLAVWKRLREQLDSKFPSQELGKTITQLVDKAKQEFEADEEFRG